VVAIVIIVSLGLFAGLVFLIVWLVSRAKKRGAFATPSHQVAISNFSNIAAALSRNPSGEAIKTGGTKWCFNHAGRATEARVTYPAKNVQQALLSVELRPASGMGGFGGGGAFRGEARAVMPHLPTLMLRRETAADEFGKRLGLNRELQTGDHYFDETVYIESNASDDELLSVLASAQLRASVLHLLGTGAKRIELNWLADPLAVAWVTPFEGDPFAGPGLEQNLDVINTIAAELPEVASLERVGQRGSGFLLAVLTTLAAVIGVVLSIVGEKVYDPIGWSLEGAAFAIAAAIFVPLMVISWLLMRGQSAGLRMVTWMFFASLVALPTMAIGSLSIVNGAFDGPLESRRTRLISKHIHRGSKSTSYSMKVAPWSPHRRPIKLKISRSTYNQLPSASSPITLKIGHGALGYEWFDKVARYR